jgi:hypothetical protein
MTVRPAADGTQVRTVGDLERAVKALSSYFETDAVVIVGSQSVLVGWPDAPVLMGTSGEIDAYPANARVWEQANPGMEASEEVAALFGQDSPFNVQYGFYIDGVDDTTAKLPPGWQTRAVFREIKGGTTLLAVAPCTDDMVVAKLFRLVEKDRAYIAACHEACALDIAVLKQRFTECGHAKEFEERAFRFLDGLLQKPPAPRPSPAIQVPPYPLGTHAALLSNNGRSVTIREWDEDLKLYVKRGNTPGPAIIASGAVGYAVHGELMSEDKWRAHPEVVQAMAAAAEPPSDALLQPPGP